ncbi:uncharacterized protein LOC127874091 [Dreissena polymorpha]|uniref:Uncharacterized protein n=1 Tax=Dreissena polymorpha TaxID=45954 RepID=A0A9D4MLN0_DREPO|nr:uncharacterized protein LOC127874091 [Dreissena polymorpha]XP_052274184.1 uncharacterized protein LOC127874091 [Dreissena polymorpha]XP_052274193.1 uncharacterized protein LOC127874091 [Dreissena polymorpha]KAH3878239.1 hypothetical protein DPMN_002126 [Dreissena polymorpha]
MRSDNIDRIAPSLHMRSDNIDRIAPSLHMRSDNIDRIATSLHTRSDTATGSHQVCTRAVTTSTGSPKVCTCAVTTLTGSPLVCTCAVTQTPPSRPNAAVFSFRNNENVSHSEVQYLIQTQLDVHVRSIQFDPLDIRSARPGVNSRWVVEFCTTADMAKAIQSGLQVGTDRLVFYPHDVTTRETAANRNYMEVVNAHAVIAASADNAVRGKLKNAVSSGRRHSRP